MMHSNLQCVMKLVTHCEESLHLVMPPNYAKLDEKSSDSDGNKKEKRQIFEPNSSSVNVFYPRIF